jgi:hypothetical protein
MEPMSEHEHAPAGQHSYYDWQLATLMYAYDVAEPLPGSDQDALAKRMQSCEFELYELAKAVIPEGYWTNQGVNLSPEVVMRLTQATIIRAAQIMKLVQDETDGQ